MLEDDEFKLFLKTLGARIRQLRKEKHLLMRDIMIATGYYDAQWRKYESGGSLTVASLLKIALALNVSLSELLDGLGQWPILSVAEISAQKDIRAEAASRRDRGADFLPSPKGPADRVAIKKRDQTTRKRGRAQTPGAPDTRLDYGTD